ncbi:MAG: hypothetical protein BGO60_13790 [Thiobacillus sp. 65-1059]|nr:MAG: hypothetical protein BGO60_13790 [Thiobacillus sp. 65-1059]
MKNTLMKTALGILALGLTATGAQAGWTHGRDGNRHADQQTRAYSQQIDTRQQRQMERIESGLHGGLLSRAEFRELTHEQHAIRAMERRFRADGVIDAREFRRLSHALDLASHNIKTAKHDRQVRYAHGHPSRFN